MSLPCKQREVQTTRDGKYQTQNRNTPSQGHLSAELEATSAAGTQPFVRSCHMSANALPSISTSKTPHLLLPNPPVRSWRCVPSQLKLLLHFEKSKTKLKNNTPVQLVVSLRSNKCTLEIVHKS